MVAGMAAVVLVCIVVCMFFFYVIEISLYDKYIFMEIPILEGLASATCDAGGHAFPT